MVVCCDSVSTMITLVLDVFLLNWVVCPLSVYCERERYYAGCRRQDYSSEVALHSGPVLLNREEQISPTMLYSGAADVEQVISTTKKCSRC